MNYRKSLGQYNRMKVETAGNVELVVLCYEKAIQLLKSQLYEMEIEARNAKRAEIEAGKKKIEWGSQIRNYVMHPYKLVKDVRTGHETSNVDGVMNGELDDFIKAFLMQEGLSKRVEEQF